MLAIYRMAATPCVGDFRDAAQKLGLNVVLAHNGSSGERVYRVV